MSAVNQTESASNVDSDPVNKGVTIRDVTEPQEPKSGKNMDAKPQQMATATSTGPAKAAAPGQNWKNANTLESNGVSVTVVNSTTAPRVNGKPATPTTTSPASTPGSANQAPAAKQGMVVSGPKPSPVTGTAKCENCGVIGVKHAFYTKQRNYCSANCVKEAQGKIESAENSPVHKRSPSAPMMSNVKSDRGQLQDNNINSFEADLDDSTGSAHETSRSSSSASVPMHRDEFSKLSKPAIKKGKAKQTAPPFIPQEPPTYDWTPILDDPKFEAASVACFKHVPWAHVWDNVTVGMKVEVENKDVNNLNFQIAFWVASVLQIQGYKVKLRFEGFGNDPTHDFWVNLCSPDVHHVGWCATKEKPLIPPNTIANRHSDWREFLVKRLTGARTLPHNFQTKVDSGQKSRYPFGTQLEVVDKMRISQLRLAEVRGCMGKRLHLVYFDSADNEGFWCHEDSALIHRCGWAKTVGQEISAPDDYQPDFLPPSAFKTKQEYSHIQVKEGMKLEAIDPLNLSVICAATIKKVLKYGYIMVRVDCYEEDPTGSDWFCYHITSSSLFQCGFCAKNDIPLVPPYGYDKESFTWEMYFADTGAKTAPLQALKKPPMKVPLKNGMKLEAADLMDPRLVCVATIARVIGNLLKIHFDGWEEEYDQWLDAGSPDIYPVGWCEIVKHRLELPPQPVKPKTPKPKTKKAKKMIRSSPTDEVAKKKPKLQLNQPIATVRKPQAADGSAEGSEKADVPKEAPPKPIPAKTDQPGAVTTNETGARTSSSSDMDRRTESTELPPEQWTKEDVAQFLRQKDYEAYVESFLSKNIDGPALIALTKDQLIELTGMKLGPAVKILDMVVQLKKSSSARKASLNK